MDGEYGPKDPVEPTETFYSFRILAAETEENKPESENNESLDPAARPYDSYSIHHIIARKIGNVS